MFSSLRSRLLLSHLLVGGVVLLVLSISFLLILVNNPVADRFVYGRLETISRVGSAQLRLRAPSLNPETLERRLALLGRPIGAGLALFDADGQIRFGSAVSGPSPSYQLVLEASGSEEGRTAYRDDSGRRWLLVATPLSGGRILAAFAPAPTVRTVALLLREAVGPLWQAAAMALVSSALLAFLIARWIARPLTKMAGAAGALAEGKDEQEVSPGGPTEVRELAAAFNEMVRRVQASQQAQRDFVANVSHELKTPLTSIRGFAQALVEGAVVGEEGRQRAARVIREEAERLHRLVDDLLELARFDAGQVGLKREPTDMRSLLERAMDRIRPLATEGGIRLELEVEQLPTVISDGDRLAQVFTNLLDNAVAHTPAGGLVSVKATGSGGWIRVEIADTGEGIEPARLPRLFERFYQGDEARAGGVGLGLAISDEIVRAHGGQISAESEVGVGSRFIVQIPVAMPSDSTVSARRL